MGLWSWLTGVNYAGEQPNMNVPSSVGPDSLGGDPEGVVFEGDPVEPRALASIIASPWAGWPRDWSTPNWDWGNRFNSLVDVAWTCLDKNASALSAMPVYRTRDGQVISSATWMQNPDSMIYSSWAEFAKQLFWDFQLGEAFVLNMSSFSDGYPMRFRVIPPWAINVEMQGGSRVYHLGTQDVTSDILHIRYKSTTDGARGVGPLEVAGGRMITAGVLAKYVRDFADSGGVVLRTLETDQSLDEEEAQDLLNQYMASRVQHSVAPAVLDGGAKLVDHQAVAPGDAAMLELAQFTESRIAILLGVPPFLAGLPAGGDPMTYSNVSSLFDFHDRQTLRPMATHVMSALSNWALPAPQQVELNRDEYSRPDFAARAEAWVKLVTAGIVTPEQVQRAERIESVAAVTALTGGA